MGDRCPLGADCDLTTAYMAGHERGKDTAAATIAELRKEVERLRGENERYESFALRVAAFMALDTATASCWNAYNTKMDDREREARAALQGETK